MAPVNTPKFQKNVRAVASAVVCLLVGASGTRASDGAASFAQVARQVQPKIVDNVWPTLEPLLKKKAK